MRAYVRVYIYISHVLVTACPLHHSQPQLMGTNDRINPVLNPCVCVLFSTMRINLSYKKRHASFVKDTFASFCYYTIAVVDFYSCM